MNLLGGAALTNQGRYKDEFATRGELVPLQPGISLIWDIFEMQAGIPRVINAIAAEIQNLGFDVEIIIVDRGSGDQSVYEALQAIKANRLQGKVIQNGPGWSGAALNSGILRSSGKYLSFLRPNGYFFRGHFKALFEAAEQNAADFTFGEIISTEYGAGRLGAFQRVRPARAREGKGAAMLLAALKGEKAIDLGCLLIRREFVLESKISFNEDTRLCCEEEFIYRCLLLSDCICEIRGPFARDKSVALTDGQAPPEFACFDRVDAMVRFYEELQTNRKENKRVIHALKEQKIPQIILDAVEELLRNGRGYNAVRHYLNKNGYQTRLQVGRHTPVALGRKILLWRSFPWMYS